MRQPPAIVLGCAQRHLRSAVQCRSNNRVAVLQRAAGGGAVLTGPWMVSASIVLPPRHPLAHDGLLGCYRWLGQVHADVLREFGIAVHTLPAHDVPRADAMLGLPPVDWACFGRLSPWEVVSPDYRKLVGLAQRRRHNAILLVAGTLIAPPDWPLLCEPMAHPEHESLLRRRTVSVRELVRRRIRPEIFASVLRARIQSSLEACSAMPAWQGCLLIGSAGCGAHSLDDQFRLDRSRELAARQHVE